MSVLQVLHFVVREQIKGTLACVWHEELFYAAGLVPQNRAFLVDEKPWVSMPLIQYRSTMPTRLTFLVFGFSTNVLLTLLTSWLLSLYT